MAVMTGLFVHVHVLLLADISAGLPAGGSYHVAQCSLPCLGPHYVLILNKYGVNHLLSMLQW